MTHRVLGKGLSGALLAVALLASAAPSQAQDRVDPLLSAALEPWTGDLDGMVKRGLLRVAIPYGVTTFYMDGTKARGLTFDHVQQFRRHVRKTLGKAAKHLSVVVVPTARDEIFERLLKGQADVAAGILSVTESRARQVAFSDPIYPKVAPVFVTGPGTTAMTGAIASIDDLASIPIHLQPSSSFYEEAIKANAARVAAGKAPLEIVEADEDLHIEDILDLVATGVIPATLAEAPVAAFFARVFEDLTVHDSLPLVEGHEIAWAFRKSSPQLAKAVNGYIKTAKKGTLIGNMLLRRYTQDTETIENALAPQEQERFEELVGLFQTYAGRYDFDWIMIGAQGFQESRLDQTARSAAGAVGIMQILPTTARDPNVNLPDIHETETNIHAGVRYLRFLRDRYFSDADLTELDRVLFSFAAYNAGPANIRKARRQAARMKLDPDIWFDNVEIAAARTISREPVVYVRNIFKYYVAYKLLVERGKGLGPQAKSRPRQQ